MCTSIVGCNAGMQPGLLLLFTDIKPFKVTSYYGLAVYTPNTR